MQSSSTHEFDDWYDSLISAEKEDKSLLLVELFPCHVPSSTSLVEASSSVLQTLLIIQMMLELLIMTGTFNIFLRGIPMEV